RSLYAQHRGKASDRWYSYIENYDDVFHQFRDKPIYLLEIGIQNGGSLSIWAEYFASANKIVGCDIDQKCADLRFDDQKICLVIGDATSEAARRDVLKHATKLDIIIDDGSHIPRDIIKTFMNFFPYLTDGGIYVVEDLHCSYWDNYSGGLFHPFSSISFFKLLVDVINYEHWGVDRKRGQIVESFFKRFGCRLSDDVLAKVHSIEFMNSICIIRKNKVERNILNRRVVVGSVASVKPVRNLSTQPFKKDQSCNGWATEMPPGERIIE